MCSPAPIGARLVLALLILLAPAAAHANGGEVRVWGWEGTPDFYGLRAIPAPNDGYLAIASGQNHCLGLRSSGEVAAWGWNQDGQCNVPAPNSGFIAIAAGERHSAALRSDGTVAAWGFSDYGQGAPPSPNAGFVAIAAGGRHNLALRSDSTIHAWGGNWRGQCDVPAPNTGYVAVAAGSAHSLGLKSDGSVVAWGFNDFGQCDVPAPNSGFIAIAAGYHHSLGLKSDGTVVAWGRNEYGQGVAPSPNAGFVAIAAGFRHNLALRNDGAIQAWGQNALGQCNVPEPNAGFMAIGGGEYHSVAVGLDVVKPSAVHDLAVSAWTSGSITLSWTAVGDDSLSGTAGAYDVRYATTFDTPWDAMTPVAGAPDPLPAGSAESFTITGLSPRKLHWFRIRVADEASNWSSVSTPAGGTTWPPSPDATFGGLRHFTLGNATLGTVGDSVLVISDLGLGGDDGVAILAGDFDGITILWTDEGHGYDVPEDAGSAVRATLLGKRGATVVGPVAVYVEEVTESSVNIRCASMACADSCHIAVFDGANLVHAGVYPIGEEVHVLPPPGRKAIKENGVQYGTARWLGDHVREWAFPLEMQIGPALVTGDRVVWSVEDPLCDDLSLSDLRLEAADPGGATDALALRAVQVGLLGAQARALGPATELSVHADTPGDPVRLRVYTHGDSSGMAGCAIGDPATDQPPRLELVPGGEAVYAGLELSIAQEFVDADMVIAPVGTSGGVSGQELGRLRLDGRADSTGVDLFAGNLGPAGTRVEVWSTGTLLYSGVTEDSLVAGILENWDPPWTIAYDIAASSEAEPGFLLRWETPVLISAAGGQWLADEVRLGATGRTRDLPDGVTGLAVRTTAIDFFDYLDFNSTALPAPSTVDDHAATAVAPVRLAVWPSPAAGNVRFLLDRRDGGDLDLEIFDAAGRRVRSFATSSQSAGGELLVWDGRTEAGGRAPSGVYFARLRSTSAARSTAESTVRFLIVH